jgi:hypothetical protein
MPILTNPFNGRMNLDDADFRVISNGDYVDALNITKDNDSGGEGQDSVASGIIGNSLVSYSLPSGFNKIIGFKEDEKRNRAYYFLWNSNKYHTILYYDNNNKSIVSVLINLTQTAGVDILEFDPSYKILSVNIVYRDTEGDILFFNSSNTQPKCINVKQIYSVWRKADILVIKAPPITPPQVVYEYDSTTFQNNLRNSLFQFCYRYVYDTQDKSVWSTRSIVPLPQQNSINYTSNEVKENSRISVNFSTGGQNVKGVELAFRQSTEGITTDWKLIKLFDKVNLGISDDSIYTFWFKNDSVYVPIDINETDLLQDYVPLRANASELANGNTLLYAGTTEGYNKTKTLLSGKSLIDWVTPTNFFYDKCGLLFFATINGQTSGTFSANPNTFLNIYLLGTGTNNSSNLVTTLNNAAAEYVINLQTSSGLDIGISYTNAGLTGTTSSILTAIAALLVTKNFSQVGSITANQLTMRVSGSFGPTYNSNTVLLNSSGVKYLATTAGQPDNTTFANSWDSGYSFAIQYFDSEGRTIGAQTNADATFQTQGDTIFSYPQLYIEIANRPPLEAAYFHLLRSGNTSYSKRFYWVSNSAYQSSDINGKKYAYVGLENIVTYNKQISSTEKVVSYEFTQGDRIRFLRRYDVTGNPEDISTNFAVFDYEILGVENNIKTVIVGQNATISKTGFFIKINYPTADISTLKFNFSGTDDYQNYEIFIYNYALKTDIKTYFEFGKMFAIGNPGTANAYHFGLERQQSASDPQGVTARISASNGDLFYRKRNVVISRKYDLKWITTPVYTIGYIEFSYSIAAPNFPTINNALYQISTQFPQIVSSTGASYPVFADTGFLFWNKSATKTIKLNIKVTLVLSTARSESETVNIAALICSNAGVPVSPKYTIQISETITLESTPITINIDTDIDVPPSSKLWIIAQRLYTPFPQFMQQMFTSGTYFYLTVLTNQTIDIIESSFTDNSNILTNSNGRASAVEENAAQTYYPALIRFGQEYQLNTSLNNINRFYPQDFDEYDNSYGDIMRLHIRDRTLIVYQKLKVGRVPVLTQIIKDVTGNPLQANSDKLINKIQYYAGDFGIGDADTSLAWNNFSDYFVDNYRGVVCRLSQDGITAISILYKTNSFFTNNLGAYRKSLNNGISLAGVYTGDPCIYGVFDAVTNRYFIAMEEINRYAGCGFAGGICYILPDTTTTTTTSTTTTTTTTTSTTTTTTLPPCNRYINNSAENWVGDYQICGGAWVYGGTLAPSATVCAVINSPFTLSGMDLEATGNCTFKVYIKAEGTVSSFPNLIINVSHRPIPGTGGFTNVVVNVGNPLSYVLVASNIPFGSEVIIGIDRFGVGSADIQYGIGFNGGYTGYCGVSNKFNTVVTGYNDIYVNANVVSNDYVNC